jgi:hypothetical protein
LDFTAHRHKHRFTVALHYSDGLLRLLVPRGLVLGFQGWEEDHLAERGEAE